MRAIARAIAAKLDVRVFGAEHVPRSGPALLVCRHYHHLYDGAVLTLAVPRPLRIVVGLDWTKDRRQRRYMEAMCRLARWPVVLRDPGTMQAWGDGYGAGERRTYARSALDNALDVLLHGDVLAMFPEGAPVVDPQATLARAQWPEFRTGYLAIAACARRRGLTVPLVPAGLQYNGSPERPRGVIVRFGAPVILSDTHQRANVAHMLQARVRALSE
jgi:putative membrane protein